MKPSVKEKTRTRKKPRVVIWIDGTFAVVEPPLQDVLLPLFATRRARFRRGGRTGVVKTVECLTSCFVPNKNQMLIPAGMAPKAADYLRMQGYEVEERDHTRPRANVALDDAALSKMGTEPQKFVGTLLRNRHGLIAARSFVDRVMLINFAVRAFGTAGITVVSASRKEAKRWVRFLERAITETVGYFTGGYYLSEIRIRVATFHSVNPGWADLLFFADARDALTEEGKRLYYALKNNYIYCFQKPGEQFSPGEARWLERCFGSVLYQIPSTGGLPADVRVLFATAPPACNGLRDRGLERKRRALWHNDARNEVVAEVADALARGKNDVLWRHGLFVDAGDSKASATGRRRQVALIVESPEHGRELLPLLPSWTLNTWNGDREWQSPAEETASDAARQSGAGVIVTLASALYDPDVLCESDTLVRAEGGSGGLSVRGFPPRATAGSPDKVLVVDVADDFDDQAKSETQRRIEQYRSRGWDVVVPGCLRE